MVQAAQGSSASGWVRRPRLVIGAPQGRSGKTTVSLGLSAALAARGLVVQPFKKGPDYIDPSWLSEAAGRPCRTLDTFFLAAGAGEIEHKLRRAYLCGVPPGGLGLIEGNHGLYDSAADDLGTGSTAALSRMLKTPVILVVNAARMGRSVAALVRGFQDFEPDTPIAGLILNHVAGAESPGSRHLSKLRQAVEKYCRIPLLGALPRNEAWAIPDRHLGLVPRAEEERLVPAIRRCRAAVEKYVDLETVLAIANAAPDLPEEETAVASGPKSIAHSHNIRIGVIRDRAFSFYYPENLEALEAAGAQLHYFDAFQTPRLPDLDGLYIGGGFPELFMHPLSANQGLLSSLRLAVEDGLPVYAECGGLMYLCRTLSWRGERAQMAGVFPYDVEMSARPQGHGYVQARVESDNPFFLPGTELYGHEFHHSHLLCEAEIGKTAYNLKRGRGLGNGRDGLVYRNVLAAYTHLHIDGTPDWAKNLVRLAHQYSGREHVRAD